MVALSVAIGGALLLGFFYWQRKQQNAAQKLSEELLLQAQAKAKIVLDTAKLTAQEIILKAEQKAHAAKEECDKELRALSAKEELATKEKNKAKAHSLELEKKEKALIERERKLQEDLAHYSLQLNLTVEEARRQVIQKAENETEKERQVLYQHMLATCEERIEQHVQGLIVTTLGRLPNKALESASTTTIFLPNEEIKAKIIGREGKNIKAFQQLTGVTVVIDETPETLVLSSFDPQRREIAKMALEALISDGRITLTRIEEEVAAASALLDTRLLQYGQQAASSLHLIGLHPTLLTHLGRLKLRTSLGQNLLEHSVEVAEIMGLIAGELKLNVSTAIRMGLLHDIGKAVVSDIPLSHALSGYRLCLDCGESEVVANGVGCHHDEMPAHTLEAKLVKCADYLSGARRGVRAENSETFFKRLRDFEAQALSFAGVKSAFALAAGRELQVFVRPEVVDDSAAVLLAKQIAQKIQPLAPSLRIQVSVIRETKAVQHT